MNDRYLVALSAAPWLVVRVLRNCVVTGIYDGRITNFETVRGLKVDLFRNTQNIDKDLM